MFDKDDPMWLKILFYFMVTFQIITFLMFMPLGWWRFFGINF